MEQNQSVSLTKGEKEMEEEKLQDVNLETETFVDEEENKREVHSMDFDELQDESGGRGDLDLDFILDIPLTVNVELGKSRLLISELLQLGQGSVLELTKLAGEPMDVFVNDRLIARGEVVVVNEKFGVRLTDVVSPSERISRLR